MDEQGGPRGDAFARWLEDRLSRELGSVTGRRPPRWALRAPRRLGMPLGNLIATGAAVLALGGVTAMAAANLTSAPIGGSGPGSVASPTAHVCSAGETGGQAGCVPPGTLVSATGASSPHPLTHQGDTVSESAGATASPSPNHGQAVSNAAHTCPTGSGGVHGSCVSAVAHGSPKPSGVASPSPGSGHGHH